MTILLITFLYALAPIVVLSIVLHFLNWSKKAKITVFSVFFTLLLTPIVVAPMSILGIAVVPNALVLLFARSLNDLNVYADMLDILLPSAMITAIVAYGLGSLLFKAKRDA